MYAKMKDENKLLINRLDDSEQILIKSFLETAKNSDVKFNEVYNEDGNFDGIFISLVAKEPEVNNEPEEPSIEEPEE